MKCRFCSHELSVEFIDLNDAPPSNSFLSKEGLDRDEAYYPLKLYVCDQCFLVQVDEYKLATEIFDEEYVYFSSYSKSWLAHSKAYCNMMVERFGFNEDSLVTEIASNDGYLLQYFQEKSIPVLGIEPTLSTAKVSREKGIENLVAFFGVELAQQLADEGRKTDLLLGNNVLAHVPNINDFVGGFKVVLKERGVVTMEFPHLMQLIQHNQFDTIYHEHFSYLSLTTVCNIFHQHGLELFDVEELPTHGGSLRIFGKHVEDETKPVTERLEKLLQKEREEGLTTVEYYKGFAEKAELVKMQMLQFLEEQKAAGTKVAAYGAAAKGNTLLNYCEVKDDVIKFVVDASPHKQGKYLPGSHIPVVEEAEIRKYKPNYIIILPWNIQQEIMEQLDYIKEWGGKFVIPIPQLAIV